MNFVHLARTHLLSSNRSITLEDGQKIMLFKESKLSIKQMARLMELEINIQHGDVSFTKKDLHNLFTKVKKEMIGAKDTMDPTKHIKMAK